MSGHYQSILNQSFTGYAFVKIVFAGSESNEAVDFEFLEANRAFESITGLRAASIVGKKLTEVFTDISDDIKNWFEFITKNGFGEGKKEFVHYFQTLKKWLKTGILPYEKDAFALQIYDVSQEMKTKDENTAILLSLNDIVFEIDENYVFQKVFVENESYLFMPKKDILGKNIKDIFPVEMAANFVDTFKKACETGRKVSVVYPSPFSGDNRWFEAIVKYDQKTAPPRYIISIGDITNQNKLKEDLYQKTQELEKFFDVSLDLLCIADSDGNFIKVNTEWERVLGYSKSFLEKSKFFDFIHPEDRNITRDIMSKIFNNEEVLNFTNRYRCKNGAYRYIEWRSRLEGKYIYAAARDITELVTEKQLLEKMVYFAEEFLQIYDTDLDYHKIINDFREITNAKVAAFNLYEEDGFHYSTMAISAEKGIIKKATQMMGMRVTGKRWEHDPVRAEKIKENLVTVFPSLLDLTRDVIPKTIISLLNMTFGLGETVIVKIQRNNIMLGDFTIIMPKKKRFDRKSIAEMYSRQLGLVLTQKRTETKLKESEERYRLLSDVTLEGILIHKDGVPRDLNDSLCRLIGDTREALLKKNLIDVIHEDDRELAIRNIKTNYSGIYTLRAKKQTGGTFIAELQGRELIVGGETLRVVAIRDVTKQKEAELALIESNNRYDVLARQSRTIAWEVDAAGMYTFVSEVAKDVWGYAPEELVNKKYFYDIHPDPDAFKKEAMLIVSKNEAFTSIIKPVATKTGSILWFSTNGLPILDKNGKLKGYRGSDADITQRKHLEEEIYNEKERFRTTLLSVGDGVISTDREGKVLTINKVAEALTGWTQKEAYGKDFEQVFHIINEHTRERLQSPVKMVLETGKIIELANHTLLVSKNGEERSIEDSAAPIKDERGIITGVVLVFRDFTDKKEKQEKILFLSYNDQMTGLYNRRFFEEELVRIDQEKNYPLTLVMFDVNGLKLTNDAFGHLVGDKVIKTIAEIMKRCCRQKDIIARIGGDEFVILLPNTSYEDASHAARRISEDVKAQKIEGINLSVSYGCDTKISGEQDIMHVFKIAEDKMYRQKLSESQSIRYHTINIIVKTLYEKSRQEEMHSKRVAELCAKIGEALNLSKEDIDELKTAGLMHDIGKIAIEDTILNKKEKLTEEEWQILKRHPETGYKILQSVNEFAHIAKQVLQHHERWDGKGYPKGLEGEQIEYKARILSIADVYDFMTSEKPYSKGLSEQEAVKEMIAHSGTQFDPELVKVFVEKVLLKQWED